MKDDDDFILKVENLSKKFCRSLKRNMLYSMYDMLSFIFTKKINSEKLRTAEFFALKDVSFTLKKGESLGLIGLNGCGKSTLLRVITGIYPPSSGRAIIKGRIGSLISVGAGFHEQMSGRDNIYLNGTILGLTKEEIEREFDKIVEFSELGDFLDAPVQTYSSGMRVRLGFSIAVHADVDMLIADEVLAVGDSTFRLKCFNKIGELKKKGVSIILVSHDPYMITGNCEKGAYLKKGELKFFGDVYEATSLYQKDITLSENKKIQVEKKKSYESFVFLSPPYKGLSFQEVKFDKPFVDGFLSLKTHEDLSLSFFYKAEEDIKDVCVNYSMTVDNYPKVYSRIRSVQDNLKLDIKKGEGEIKVTLKDINIVSTYGSLWVSIVTPIREYVFSLVEALPFFIDSNDSLTSYDIVSHFNYEIENIPVKKP